jgi:hypothetical protein
MEARRKSAAASDGNDGGPRRATHTDTQLERWLRHRKKQLHAMFEKYVSSIILTLANKYIKNVNASELKLSLWGAPPPPQPISQSAPRRRESLAREY